MPQWVLYKIYSIFRLTYFLFRRLHFTCCLKFKVYGIYFINTNFRGLFNSCILKFPRESFVWYKKLFLVLSFISFVLIMKAIPIILSLYFYFLARSIKHYRFFFFNAYYYYIARLRVFCETSCFVLLVLNELGQKCNLF